MDRLVPFPPYRAIEVVIIGQRANVSDVQTELRLCAGLGTPSSGVNIGHRQPLRQVLYAWTAWRAYHFRLRIAETAGFC